ADPERSSVAVVVGPGALCTNEADPQVVQVVAVDAAGNGIAGAAVTIEQVAGDDVRWRGPVEDLGGGRYERRFTVARRPGTVRFAATIDGVEPATRPVLELYDAESAEGRFIGCQPGPVPGDGWSGCWLWVVVALVLLVIFLLVLVLRRKRS
ncbi:MAG: invasin domain 3-containing protein, partial [Acidimicrobiales bacterium]